MTTGWRFVANDKWKNDTCPCIHKWRGVVCDSVGHIVSLNLATEPPSVFVRVSDSTPVCFNAEPYTRILT